MRILTGPKASSAILTPPRENPVWNSAVIKVRAKE